MRGDSDVAGEGRVVGSGQLRQANTYKLYGSGQLRQANTYKLYTHLSFYMVNLTFYLMNPWQYEHGVCNNSQQ